MFFIDKENYYWTDHVRRKMRQYQLSESRIKRILRYPKRVEVGIAEDTVAGMQPAGSKKHPFEIWVMWTQKNQGKKVKRKKLLLSNLLLENERGRQGRKFSFGNQVIIISAWRYPGVSPRREPPPIPDDVWEEVRRLVKS